MKSFYDKVSLLLEKAVKEKYNLVLKYPLWESPARQNFGDLSTAAALKISSKRNRNPLEVAAEIKNYLYRNNEKDIEKIEIVKPGFINLFLSRDLLLRSLGQIISRKENYFKGHRKRKALIEFVSANPTGPLSVAHGRQAVVGDVAANILEFFGDKVTREYYLNDEGRQIELLTLSVAARIKEIKHEDFKFPDEGYKGDYVKDIAADYLKKAPRESIRDFCLAYLKSLIEEDLKTLGISFDNWFSQRSLIDKRKVEEVAGILEKKGFLYQKDGALWFSASKFLDSKDRVIKKSDGSLTYFASDIAYHYDKCRRGYDKLINFWGPDHHGYIGRIKSVLKALGWDEDILEVIIIQLVSLKSKVKMSKRAGALVCFSDLIEKVGKDAARFYYLTRKNSSHLEFDIDLAQKNSFENPLYYIQYVCARIESIFRKSGIKPDKSYIRYINDSWEIDMIRFLLQFFLYLRRAYYLIEPVFIVEYLKNLAAMFHKFYENVRVLGDDPKKTGARLLVLQATKIVFCLGLEIMGIKPAERM